MAKDMGLIKRLAKHRVCLGDVVKSEETGTPESVEDPLPLFLKMVNRFRFYPSSFPFFIAGQNFVLAILDQIIVF